VKEERETIIPSVPCERRENGRDEEKRGEEM
jgi:hypothetical protein